MKCCVVLVSHWYSHFYLRFCQAGNLFKMAKLWKEAGDAFVRAAELHGSKVAVMRLCLSARKCFVFITGCREIPNTTVLASSRRLQTAIGRLILRLVEPTKLLIAFFSYFYLKKTTFLKYHYILI